ncbi:MAG TPA: hypothetical protein ENF34_01415 [Candidatus Bathyarchaeota archaeon]|nr:hypothetical protein [Candidatus Bathyarchaeota archaeon]
MEHKALLLAITAVFLAVSSAWLSWCALNSPSGQEATMEGVSWESYGLRFELSVDLEEKELVVRMAVENVASEPITLAFRTSQVWDVEIRDSGGRVLWRWSAGKAFLQVVQYRKLAPGEEMAFQTEWEAPGPGHYTVVGYFLGHLGDLSGPRPPPLTCHVKIG